MDSIHYSWEVFEFEEEVDNEIGPVKRCYVMAKPNLSKTSYSANRDAYISVTRFENDGMEEVSISAGFEYKINGKIYALVGDETFALFTREKSAWLGSAIKDKNFIQKMLNSDSIKVRSNSSIGSYAIDTYSLKGFARAYRRMKSLCE